MESDFYMDDFEDFNAKTILLVKQLTIKCPVDDPLQNCPFSELRNLALKEKLETVDRMSSGELEELVQKHYDCFHEREYIYQTPPTDTSIKNLR